MKHILSISTIILSMLMISCEKGTVPVIYQQNASLTEILYTFIQKENILLLIPNNFHSERDIFFLNGVFSENLIKTITIQNIFQFDKHIEILESNGTKIVLSINPNDPNAYIGNSLIMVRGTENRNIFYTNGKPKLNPDVSAIKCGCIENANYSECKNGGAGSSECSVESNYYIAGGNQIGQKCSVKCSTGYYSCCNK